MEIKWLLTCACCSLEFYALLNFALVPPETFSHQKGGGQMGGFMVVVGESWGCSGTELPEWNWIKVFVLRLVSKQATEMERL